MSLKEKIKAFLYIPITGYGYGYGDGYGNGDGDGYGDGYGNGDGYGYGYGDGYGNGDGDGDGNGDGNGDGDGDGYGYGNGYGKTIQSINNNPVITIDNTPTVVYHIRGNVLKGGILNLDLSIETCYVIKQDNTFSHGKTLEEANKSLLEKLLIKKPIEERIEDFTKLFNLKNKYKAEEFYTWHYLLTGSCSIGRNNFMSNHSITKESTLTVKEFIELTESEYQGSIIKQLKTKLKIK